MSVPARLTMLSRHWSTRQRRRELLGRVLFGGFGWLLNRAQSMFILSYRPDVDYDHEMFSSLPYLRAHWIKGNAKNNLGDLSRLYMLALNARKLLEEDVPGDFAELGVYKGNSARILAEFSRESGRTLFLFDTFSGFDPRETRELGDEVAGAFRDTSLQAVKAFVGDEGVVYVPGFFPGSLNSAPAMERFALVHIDCDLYEPMKAGLEYFYPRTSPGGLLMLHDYASGHWPGVRTAVDEFLQDKPERVVLIPDKSGTAVLRKV